MVSSCLRLRRLGGIAQASCQLQLQFQPFNGSCERYQERASLIMTYLRTDDNQRTPEIPVLAGKAPVARVLRVSLAKGGYHDRIRNGVCAERTKAASAASPPTPSTSSRQALAKTQGLGTLNFQSLAVSDNRYYVKR